MSNPHMPHDDSVGSISQPLSREGLARRDAMLIDLVGQMRCVHRGRRLRKQAMLAAAPVVIAALALAMFWRWPRDGETANAPIIAIDHPQPHAQPHIAQPAALITFVTDDELLEELAAIDRPTGLVRAGDKVWLTGHVTDDSPSESQPATSG